MHNNLPDLEDFRSRVYHVTHCIPSGRVCTYGHLAYLAGSPGAARAVGTFMRQCLEHDAQVPWQRVINAQGGISFKGDLVRATRQLELLQNEGVVFHRKFICDLETYEWEPDEDYWSVDFAEDA